MRGLFLVVASGGHSSSQCAGLSLSRPLLLRSTDSRRAGSVIAAHGTSCSAACGIFPDQGSNPCPLHWQADSQPLCHQGSPILLFFKKKLFYIGVQLINNVVLVSGVQQSDSVIHIHVSILFQILLPIRLLQNIEQSSLCYAVGPCWLSILFYFLKNIYLVSLPSSLLDSLNHQRADNRSKKNYNPAACGPKTTVTERQRR